MAARLAALLLLASLAANDGTPSDGDFLDLVHDYDFTAGSGTRVPDGVGDCAATIWGGAALAGGAGLKLDGVDDYVEFPEACFGATIGAGVFIVVEACYRDAVAATRKRSRARASATRGRRAGDGMVLYDAMIVVSAKVPKTACADVLRRLGASVMDAGGVVTNVASYGARTLAYEFRRPGEKHFEVRRRRSERSRGFARRDANANRTRTSSTRACEHR